MGEFTSRMKKFYKFNRTEKNNIVLIILAFTIIMGFNDGNDTFAVASWVRNLIMSLIISGLCFLIHISGQKIYAAMQGVRTEQQISWYGLGAGIALSLLSMGTITVYLPGAFKAYGMATVRPGRFRHGLNTDDVGYIALAGPVANVFFAMFSKFILFQLFGINSILLDKFIFFNFLLAFFTMMPIPGQTGLYVFFGSRLLYVMGFGTLLGYIILFLMGVYSLIGALLIGAIIWIVYYFAFEKNM